MIRKIIKLNEDFYMSLKPIRDEEGWERKGRRYNCKGLVNLLKTDKKTEFILPDEVKEEIEDYKKSCFAKKLDYLQKDPQKYQEDRSRFLNSLSKMKNNNPQWNKKGWQGTLFLLSGDPKSC